MNPAWYQALVEDLCAQNGGCTASEVQACRHLQVQGRLAGLIPGEDGSLHVFIELGQSHPESDGPLYQRLLAFNTGRPEEMSGWFDSAVPTPLTLAMLGGRKHLIYFRKADEAAWAGWEKVSRIPNCTARPCGSRFRACWSRAHATPRPEAPQSLPGAPLRGRRLVQHRGVESIMDLGIKGRWALVCGASKGLGLGCARALVREGVNVVIVARGAEALAAAAQGLLAEPQRPADTQVLHVAADITTAEGRAAALAAHEGYDILVTNAGGPPPGDFRDWDREAWIRALDANMLTPIELIKATVDGMAARGFGRIINITSGAVKAPMDTLGLSNGARSGLTGFVAGVARNEKLAQANVTVNNILPGAFDTDRLRTTMQGVVTKTGKSMDEVADLRLRTIPSRRFGAPDEFGATCAFLCSAHAGYINGQNVLIDGGAYPGTF